MRQTNQAMALLTFLFVITGCSTLVEPVKQEARIENRPSCQIIFDAGSSGTRLYVYEKQGDNWLEHPGPKVSALADPVREIRGKKNADIDAVTSEVVSALDQLKQADPADKPKWSAFDWSTQCQVTAASVYATAGMRLAEQANRAKSLALWTTLKQKLQAKVGAEVVVKTQTLTGYEEGLYAWLAVREQKKQNDFGIAEMGGASSQVTFPCPTCDAKDDATKIIQLNGQPLQIYSYSFLGLGQDEAPKTLGFSSSCAYGIGTVQANWKPSDCAQQIALTEKQGLRDPYNFNGKQRGTYRQIPTDRAAVKNWVLTGAFNYFKESDMTSCCVNKMNAVCSKSEETSCFRPIYLNKYLQSLTIPSTAERMEASWTLGAVICAANQCLEKATPPICRWSEQGCL
jgi:hypothetical protein